MRKGETVIVEIDALDDEGSGTAAVASRILHVAGALPGERVEATVEHVSPHGTSAWARLDSIVRASPARVPTACAAYGACGGCTLQHADLDLQRRWKRDEVAKHLREVGLDAPVQECVPSPASLGYRSKAKWVFGRARSGAPALGAYRPRTHELVDLAACQVIEPVLEEVRAVLLDALANHDVTPYDEKTRSGQLRYAIARTNHAGDVHLTLVTAVDDWPAAASIAAQVIERHQRVVGVVQNVNVSLGNALYGDTERAIAGQMHLFERIDHAALRLSPRAFSQSNRAVAARIYATVGDALAPRADDVLVDCYCGVGAITYALAPCVSAVIGIESNPSAIADAEAMHAQHAGDVRFVCADVALALSQVARADLIVLNPPRAGCAPAVLSEVLRLSPRAIAYVSCDPASLARNLRRLVDGGRVIRSITPFDMMPHTPHIETLVLLD